MKMTTRVLKIVLLLVLVGAPIYGAAPKRIVSLKPNITELLFAIGAGGQVVGVTTWCDRPEEAKRLPKVADYINVNVEKIIALKPDLVVSSEENSLREPVEALRNAGIPVLLLPFKKVDDLFSSTMKLADIVGRNKDAEIFIENLKKITNIRNTQYAIRNTVLIIVGKHPLVAAGRDTYLSELTTLAGGTNVIGGTVPYPNINMEIVIERDPDVIIDLSMGSEERDTKKVHSFWERYPINAVKNKRIYALNIADFRIGPGIVEQVEKLKKIIDQPIPSTL